MAHCRYCLKPAWKDSQLVIHFGDRIVIPDLCVGCLFMCIMARKPGVRSEQVEKNGVFYTHHYAPEEVCARSQFAP